jgi:transcriptional regulator with XRE-family HTH domain
MRVPTTSQRDPRIVALGAHIRGLREALGMSAADLSSTSGLSRTIIWRIERGVGNPTYTSLLQIADALGVSEHMLMPKRPVDR